MGLPLPALTFVRLADVSPTGTAISDLLDAIYNALNVSVDYRATAIPSTHQWLQTSGGSAGASRFQSGGLTEAVYVYRKSVV